MSIAKEDFLALAKLKTRSEILSGKDVSQYASLLKKNLDTLSIELIVNQLVVNQMKQDDITKMTDEQRDDFASKHCDTIKNIIEGKEKLKISKDVINATVAIHLDKLEKDGGKIYNKTKRATELIVKTSAYDKKMQFQYGNRYSLAKKLVTVGAVGLTMGTPGLAAISAYNAYNVTSKMFDNASSKKKTVLEYMKENPKEAGAAVGATLAAVATACIAVDTNALASVALRGAASLTVGSTAAAEKVAEGKYKDAAKEFVGATAVTATVLAAREWGGDIVEGAGKMMSWLGEKLGVGISSENIADAQVAPTPVQTPMETSKPVSVEYPKSPVSEPASTPIQSDPVEYPKSPVLEPAPTPAPSDPVEYPKSPVSDPASTPAPSDPVVTLEPAVVPIADKPTMTPCEEAYNRIKGGIEDKLKNARNNDNADVRVSEKETISKLNGNLKNIEFNDSLTDEIYDVDMLSNKLDNGYVYESLHCNKYVDGVLVRENVHCIIRPDGSSIDLSSVENEWYKYSNNHARLEGDTPSLDELRDNGYNKRQALNYLDSRTELTSENQRLMLTILNKLGIAENSPDAKAVGGALNLTLREEGDEVSFTGKSSDVIKYAETKPESFLPKESSLVR